jgi:hypothetical protein
MLGCLLAIIYNKHCIKLKQSFYKVFEEECNYNEVHRPFRNNRYNDMFDDGKLVDEAAEASKALAAGWRTA